MPLGREPHRRMAIVWAALRRVFAVVHFHDLQNQFQAIQLLGTAWRRGVHEANIKVGWRD